MPSLILLDAVGIEKLSGIFDNLDLPIRSRSLFEENFANAGSAMAYINPTLNDAADILLNENRNALNPDIIKAIGLNNYAELVSGLVNEDGLISPVSSTEKGVREFQRKEAEVARVVLASVLNNYSQKLLTYKVTSDSLWSEIKALKSQIKSSSDDDFVDEEREEVKFESEAALSSKVDDMISLINKSKTNNIENQKDVLNDALALHRSVNLYYEKQNMKLNHNVFTPMQYMASNFNLKMLDEPKGISGTLQEVQDKVIIFQQMANSALKNLTHPQAREALEILIEKLDKATPRNLQASLPFVSDDIKRDFIVNIYQDAAEHFANNIKEEVLKTDPPESVLNILYRIVRAIFIGSLTTDQEKEDKHRINLQITLKEELNTIKSGTSTSKDEKIEFRSPGKK